MPKEKTKEKKSKVESDDDGGPADEPGDADSAPPPAKEPAGKKSAFALMAADSDDDEDDDEPEEKPKKKAEKKSKKDEDSELAAVFGEKKKKKPKESKDDDLTAMFGEKKKKGEKKEKKPTPIVGEVLQVSPVPKKDKLRLCKVKVGEGTEVDVVTNCPNVVAGRRFVIALPGVTTADGVLVAEAKVGGVESGGMFCGPIQLGWATDVLDATLAVMVADTAEVGKAQPGYEEALQAFRDRQELAAKEKAEQEKATAASKGKKDKKKGKAAKADDEDDLDALLDEFKEAPKQEAVAKREDEEKAPQEVAAPKGKAKKDKKKAAQTGGDDDDLDALLDEFKEEPPPAPAAPQEPAKKVAEEATPKDEGEEVDAKTLANRKKKEKKKAKATGGEDMWGGNDATPTPGGADAKASDESGVKPEDTSKPSEPTPKKGGKKEPPPKKESAAVKAAREQQEAKRKLEAEREEFERAERERIAKEEAEEAAQLKKEEEERERRREAREAKIAKQKAEGTYLTKTQKLRAQRAAELRAQFGFTMEGEDGENDGQPGKQDAAAEEEQTKKRPMATKLKKKKKQAEESSAVEGSGAAVEAGAHAEAEPVAEAPSPKTEAKADDEDEDEDWEKAAEKAEEEKAEKESDEEDEESDDDESESDSDNSSASSEDSFEGYRSPIVVIMGHVDTGKTKLLDKIRRTNVQEGEAGGITQQIGATFFPDIALQEQTKKVDPDFELEVPGLMIIDTPGHESFNNLRARGSSLCDMAILVIDIMHGLEPQTVESLEMLKKRKCPFIIALNKIDVCYQWNSQHYTAVRKSLDRQEQHVKDEFQQRFDRVMLQLNERGLNVALYWENDDPRRSISIIPTSALTGEGVPDLLYVLLNLTQTLMASKLERQQELQCTVIEVKNIEGLGTTIDVVLVNGTLKEGDQIILAGMNGPIVTTIRALLTPQPMKEMRVKGDYVHHTQISTSMGVKICAPGLDEAVAGTELVVIGPEDDVEELKEEIGDGFDSILNDFEKEPEGVYVKASTLGSLEALLSFLRDMKIPVFDVGIGEVHKRDVKKAMIMKEKRHPEYAVILAFDVKVNSEAKEQAKHDDVQIMTADIIYNLFDKFKAYMEKVLESKKTETRKEVVFPVMLRIDKNCVFHKADPIVLGCDVLGGQLRVGTPICVPEKDNLEIGRIGSIEKDHKPVEKARRGERVCVKIDQNTAQKHIHLGRHFDVSNQLFSCITRSSIDTLKEHFKDEMAKEDWELIIGMKKVFKID